MEKKLLHIITFILLCSVGFAQTGPVGDSTKARAQGSPFARPGDHDDKSVSVFPNPSNGMVYLTLTGFKGKKTELRVMNVIGNVVYREILGDNETSKKDLDLSKLPSGLYYIKLQTDDYSEIRKVIIN